MIHHQKNKMNSYKKQKKTPKPNYKYGLLVCKHLNMWQLLSDESSEIYLRPRQFETQGVDYILCVLVTQVATVVLVKIWKSQKQSWVCGLLPFLLFLLLLIFFIWGDGQTIKNSLNEEPFFIFGRNYFFSLSKEGWTDLSNLVTGALVYILTNMCLVLNWRGWDDLFTQQRKIH